MLRSQPDTIENQGKKNLFFIKKYDMIEKKKKTNLEAKKKKTNNFNLEKKFWFNKIASS